MTRDFQASPIFKTLSLIQAAKKFHILDAQSEIEDIKIFGDVFFIRGAGYRDVARLNLPTEDNLRGRLGIFFREALNNFVAENFLSVASAAERIPCLDDRAEFFYVSLKFVILIEKMIFVLNDGGNNRGDIFNPVEVTRRVVI